MTPTWTDPIGVEPIELENEETESEIGVRTAAKNAFYKVDFGKLCIGANFENGICYR